MAEYKKIDITSLKIEESKKQYKVAKTAGARLDVINGDAARCVTRHAADGE